MTVYYIPVRILCFTYSSGTSRYMVDSYSERRLVRNLDDALNSMRNWYSVHSNEYIQSDIDKFPNSQYSRPLNPEQYNRPAILSVVEILPRRFIEIVR